MTLPSCLSAKQSCLLWGASKSCRHGSTRAPCHKASLQGSAGPERAEETRTTDIPRAFAVPQAGGKGVTPARSRGSCPRTVRVSLPVAWEAWRRIYESAPGLPRPHSPAQLLKPFWPPDAGLQAISLLLFQAQGLDLLPLWKKWGNKEIWGRCLTARLASPAPTDIHLRLCAPAALMVEAGTSSSLSCPLGLLACRGHCQPSLGSCPPGAATNRSAGVSNTCRSPSSWAASSWLHFTSSSQRYRGRCSHIIPATLCSLWGGALEEESQASGQLPAGTGPKHGVS